MTHLRFGPTRAPSAAICEPTALPRKTADPGTAPVSYFVRKTSELDLSALQSRDDVVAQVAAKCLR
jgi:hypothetical protein